MIGCEVGGGGGVLAGGGGVGWRGAWRGKACWRVYFRMFKTLGGLTPRSTEVV